MFSGPGLRTPRGKSSENLGTPLMEDDDLPEPAEFQSQDSFATDTSAMMPPASSDAPAEAMEEPAVPKKPAATKKKVQKKTKAPAPSEAATISLGEELVAEDFPRRNSGAGYEYSMDNIGAETHATAAASQRVGQFAAGESIDEEAQRLIAKSWQELKEHEIRTKELGRTKQTDEDREGDGPEGAQAASKKSGGFFSRFSAKKNQEGESSKGKESSSSAKGQGKGSNNNKSWDIPETFKEMVFLNAAMTGSNMSYIEIVESCFENLVSATINGDFIRLEVESNLMALRMHKDVKGKLNLIEFKTCMLASLRSLLPKSWSINHEQAWAKMWDMVQNVLTKTLPLPGRYEKAVDNAMNDMSDEDKKAYGLNAFNRFFAKQPQSEIHFNTSNARLSVLAMQGLQLCQDIYKEPTRLVNVVTSLGLKHIMFNISTDYFDSFVEACCEELADWAKDPAAVEGVEWALTQIAAIMIYTIREGSNPLLAAVITNNAKNVRKALAPLAKKDRAAVCIGAQAQIITKELEDTRK